MEQEFDTNHIDNEELLEMLINVSPLVEEHYNAKFYLTKVESEDDVTIEFLLSYFFNVIILELNDIGIIFSSDNEDLYENLYSAESLYHLRKILDPKYIYDFFKVNREYINTVQEWLTNGYVFDDLVQKLLELMDHVYSNNNYDVRRSCELLDQLVNNDDFKNYLFNILEQTKEDDNKDIDMGNYLNLLVVVKSGRDNFNEAVKKVAAQDPTIDATIMNNKIKLYDVQKLQSEYTNKIAWCYSVNYDELDDSLKKVYDDTMYLHQSTTTHHIEYWSINLNFPRTKENLVELMCHHYEPDKTKEEQLKEVDNMMKQGKDLFNSDEIQYLNFLKNILFT